MSEATLAPAATPRLRGDILGFAELLGWLVLLWVCLSDKYDAFHLALGVGSALTVAWLTLGLLREGPFTDATGRSTVRFLFRFPWHRAHTFFPWLVWQILVSNVHVAATILSRRLPIEPRLVRLPVRLESDLARLVLANAITLTPGTCVADVEGDTFVVHALTASSAASLPEMHERVARLFGEATGRAPRGPTTTGTGTTTATDGGLVAKSPDAPRADGGSP